MRTGRHVLPLIAALMAADVDVLPVVTTPLRPAPSEPEVEPPKGPSREAQRRLKQMAKLAAKRGRS